LLSVLVACAVVALTVYLKKHLRAAPVDIKAKSASKEVPLQMKQSAQQAEQSCNRGESADKQCCSEFSESCCKATSQGDASCSSNKQESSSSSNDTCGKESFKILYGTQSGTAEMFAKRMYNKLTGEPRFSSVFNVECEDCANYDPDLLQSENYVVVVMSTHIEGSPPPTAKHFYWWVCDEGLSERSRNLLSAVKFAVFGLGNSLYTAHYNTVGRNIDKAFKTLGGSRFWRRGEGDESGENGKQFDEWVQGMLDNLEKREIIGAEELSDSEGESDEEDEEVDEEPLADLEDLAGGSVEKGEKIPIKDMLSGSQKQVLTKQGYKIVGTHSSVKMCRWTKAMLRGRGGCYKHTFYGIASHQCMEATPSMACANKCVFCWRHHKNPVGKEWRWNMDGPETIIEGCLKHHTQMVKQMKGVPGVKPDRYEEGLSPRHCALSLVGEPILYPRINEFLSELHARRISSFLVTNAQFPDRIRQLTPTTQLYISVDAATPESLKAVDRPIFADFWERFLECIDELKKKRQRTVYRLTLVKGWNMEEMTNYSNLIKRGCPDFIEIKGVTYCGGKRNQLTMQNVPYHHEVVSFSQKIADMTDGQYEIASEHEHSCCVCLANVNKFKRDGKWHTWIDFDKFQDLVAQGHSNITSEDYMTETPAWAVFGAPERGFDPEERRVGHRGRPVKQGC